MSFALRRRAPSHAPRLHLALLAVLALAIVFALLAAVPARAREAVAVEPGWPAGAIVIRQSQRKLYFIAAPGQAIRYSVGVGKAGKAWYGQARVDGKYVAPAWSPPREVKRDLPHLPDVIPGGAPNNPMGARALTLDRGQYAIHGTSKSMRKSVGGAVSYGCIRMLDEDVIDLYGRVALGAPVIVVP